MWTLVLRSMEGKPKALRVSTRRITVGRRPDCDLEIADISASRLHAEFEYHASTDLLVVRDLGSTNGTFVNRERLQGDRVLKHDDVVRIGLNVIQVIRHQTDERLGLKDQGTHLLTRDVVIESIDQHAVLMYEVSRKLNDILDLHVALNEVSEMMRITMGADMCKLILESDFDRLFELGFPESIARIAIEKHAVVNIPDVSQWDEKPSRSAHLLRVRAVLCVPVLSNDEVIGLVYMYKTKPEDRPFDQRDIQLAVAISHQAALTIQRMQLLEQYHEEQRIRQVLQRFVPEAEAEYILQNYKNSGKLPSLSEQRVSILFADIADSTGLAERLDPVQFGEILKNFYREVTDIVFANNGLIDKYLGDGILAVFGMSGEKDIHEVSAVRAGLDILRYIEGKKLIESEPIIIGVGINTGPVVAGYIETRQHVEMTVLGDTVNVAAGLQKKARPNRLLIGPATVAAVVGQFPTKRFGSVSVKGRTQSIQAHEILH